MQRQDYIERMIRQIAEFVARATGLAHDGRSAEAEQELDAAWASLGLRRADAQRLDDATLRLLLGAKATLAANLFEAQADLEHARSRDAVAEALRGRAAALR